jgi:hypothetical protein
LAAITSATITAFYLFDIAEQIDLAALQPAIGMGATSARFTPKSGAPSYVRYATPPVIVEGDGLGLAEVDGFRPRVKFFDYGVLSLALTRPFAGSWTDLLTLSQKYIENEALETQAEEIARELARRYASFMIAGRAHFLSEDYLVFTVTGFEQPMSAEDLLARHSEEIALLVRGERYALSQQERDEILKGRLSYLADDLVVPTWNAALVYDTEAGAQATLEIFEFANSQLLEFRYYDELLDVELGRIYGQLQQRRWYDTLVGRGYVRATRELHALFIDVNEITDRTENALKIVGDIYAARLFQLAAARLGLGPWKASVEDKLETLDDIYHFAVEQVAISRGYLLELTIILILVFELVLFLLGIMK